MNTIIDMETIKSPEKKDIAKANNFATDLKRQHCRYIYRYERDEISNLLETLVNFVDQTEVLVTQYGKDKEDQQLFVDNLKKNIDEAHRKIQQSQEEILRQKKLQALFAKFGKRNMQPLISFLEREFLSRNCELIMNDDEFEEQFHKYVASLPQPDTNFLTTEFANMKFLDRSDDNEKDLSPVTIPTISPTVSVIGDDEHIGSEKHY